MSWFDEIREATGRVAEVVGGATVHVGGGWRGGSGVVVADGTVLTNAHNVHHDEAHVTFADGRTAVGQVRAVDYDGDLAVIAVDTAGVAPVRPTGASSLAVGTAVFSVALDGTGARVTHGFVSSVARAFRGPGGRRISGSIEHTAPMARGSSGGPLVDAHGRLVGLNTNRVGDGFYLALPADEAFSARIEAMSRGETPRGARLGIAAAPARVARRMRRAVGLPDRDGVLVREVEEGSPAARAGIAQGDLLVAAAGRPLTDVDDLHDVLGSLQEHDPLEVVVVRGAEERTLTVDLTRGDTAEGGPTDDQGATATGGSTGPVH